MDPFLQYERNLQLEQKTSQWLYSQCQSCTCATLKPTWRWWDGRRTEPEPESLRDGEMIGVAMRPPNARAPTTTTERQSKTSIASDAYGHAEGFTCHALTLLYSLILDLRYSSLRLPASPSTVLAHHNKQWITILPLSSIR